MSLPDRYSKHGWVFPLMVVVGVVGIIALALTLSLGGGVNTNSPSYHDGVTYVQQINAQGGPTIYHGAIAYCESAANNTGFDGGMPAGDNTAEFTAGCEDAINHPSVGHIDPTLW